jgi:hypothetical protein
MRPYPASLLSFPLGMLIVLWSNSGPGGAIAQQWEDRGEAVQTCVNGLLYSQILNNGTPKLTTRTEVAEDTAGEACRGVSTLEAARAKRLCVNGLLYERIFNDGSPKVSTQNSTISPELAVEACRGVRDENVAQEQRVCVNGLLYTQIFNDGRLASTKRTAISPTAAVTSCALPNSTFLSLPSTIDRTNGRRRFTIYNRTGKSLRQLYFYPSYTTSGYYDHDRWFNRDLISYELEGPCRWDLRAEFTDGSAIVEIGIDTCYNYSYTLGDEPYGWGYHPTTELDQPKRAIRQCIHTGFNNVWPDIHCEVHAGNSNTFEWRTIYVND